MKRIKNSKKVILIVTKFSKVHRSKTTNAMLTGLERRETREAKTVQTSVVCQVGTE